MARVIKLKDNPFSVETIAYVPFDARRGPLDEHQGPKPDDPDETPVARMHRIQQQMSELVDKARSEAEGIVQKAHVEAADVKEEAFQSGYEAGQEAAVKEMEEKVDSISKAFKKGLQDIASIKDSILSQAEDDIVQLTVAIAEKLVCKELEQHPDTIVAIVKEVIKSVRNEEKITIKVHPDDYTILEQYMGELMEQTGGIVETPLKLDEDPTLTSGGCIVETDTNLIDMSIESRMESILEAVTA